MLLVVAASPNSKLRIGLRNSLPNLTSNHGYSTESTMVSIAQQQVTLDRWHRHSRLLTVLLCDAFRRTRHRNVLYIRTVGAPERFTPFPNLRHIGNSNQFFRPFHIPFEMRRDSAAKKLRSLVYLINRFPEAISQNSRLLNWHIHILLVLSFLRFQKR